MATSNPLIEYLVGGPSIGYQYSAKKRKIKKKAFIFEMQKKKIKGRKILLFLSTNESIIKFIIKTEVQIHANWTITTIDI